MSCEVEMQKTSHRNEQSTSVRLTATGRAALETYTQGLRTLLDPAVITQANEQEHIGQTD